MSTGTDVTEADFLRAVLAEPGEDAHRLVYADWLDEHAADVPCPECWNRFFGGRCGACAGTGRVPDGRAARAGFIRAQVELAKFGPEPSGACECTEEQVDYCDACHGRNKWLRKTQALRRRSKALPEASPQEVIDLFHEAAE